MALRYEPFDWYETPLYYDIIFDEDTEKEVAFLEAMYRRHAGGRRRALLEPACGSGRLVSALAARGYRVSGFDVSRPMLAFARERLRRDGTKARIDWARMERFTYPRKFDMAYCFVSTFKYLLSEMAARAHLRAVARALVPGGVYVLGFHLTDYDRGTLERERWVATRNGMRVVCNIQTWRPDRKARTERVRARLIVSAGDRKADRRFETAWTFRTYSKRQFLSLLASVPELEHVATHDFLYEPERDVRFGEERTDVVAILRRR
jgi:SAM-dependent methyltransferase